MRLTVDNARFRGQYSFRMHTGELDIANCCCYFRTLNWICGLTARNFENKPTVLNNDIRWIEPVRELCFWIRQRIIDDIVACTKLCGESITREVEGSEMRPVVVYAWIGIAGPEVRLTARAAMVSIA